MAWIEGLSSSNHLLLDLAKIMTQANKDAGGAVDTAKNWQIVYPRPFDLTDATGGTMTQDAGNPLLYTVGQTDWYDQVEPVVYETVGTTTSTVSPAEYTVDYVAGTITFNDARTGNITVDYSFKTNESIETAFGKIGTFGSIVLKTNTTKVTPDTSSDPFNTDPDLSVGDLEMFLEISKPRFLLNPESGQLATRYDGSGPLQNHYHINMRIFDKYDYVTEKPFVEIVDPATDVVTTVGAKISEWSKFSWYTDFREFLKDELDNDPGTDNINDGIVFTFVDTPGLFGDVAIQYWISVNNDRLSMVLMGEPSLNYDNYLTSFAYVGKIDSFEGAVNDTAGNFALTVGSSTIPCNAKPNLDPINGKVVFSVAPVAVSQGTGDAATNNTVSYKIVAVNEYGISPISDAVQASYAGRYYSGYSAPPTSYGNFQISFASIPDNADTIRIYRKDVSVYGAGNANDNNWFLETEITRETALAGPYVCQAVQDLEAPVPVSNYDAKTAGVLRDPITGAVTEVRFPKSWGPNTATGVNDVTMYKTRSGVYYQRHQASFTTPEHFMKKDAFNPSRWTGKFHLTPLYVVHGYDGYRGWLKDVVVVDDSSIVHLDELIVNKGMANEEIYKYFKLSAPFSLMQNSANSNYGIGIKKV